VLSISWGLQCFNVVSHAAFSLARNGLKGRELEILEVVVAKAIHFVSSFTSPSIQKTYGHTFGV